MPAARQIPPSPNDALFIDGPTGIYVGDAVHAFAVTTSNVIQDITWTPNLNLWVHYELNSVVSPSAPRAACTPRPAINGDQLHLCYRDLNGWLQDLIRIGNRWYCQPVTGPGGAAGAPPAIGRPSVVFLNGFFHAIYRDAQGRLWDAYAVGTQWQATCLNTSVDGTQPPPAVGDPFAVAIGTDCHVLYRNQFNILSDVYHQGADPAWHTQWIAGTTQYGANLGATDGPNIVGDPFVLVSNTDLHVIYRDPAGEIQDAWTSDGKWRTTKINLGGVTNAPAAATDPMALAIHDDRQDTNDGVQFGYCDANQRIQFVAINGQLTAPGKPSYNVVQLTSGQDPLAIGSPWIATYSWKFSHTFYRSTNRQIQNVAIVNGVAVCTKI